MERVTKALVVRRLAPGALASAMVFVALGCGTSQPQALEQTAGHESAESTPTNPVATMPSSDEGALRSFVDALASAPINQTYDRSYARSVEELSVQSDFMVAGEILGISRADDAPFSILPEGSEQPVNPDLVYVGVKVTLEVAKESGIGLPDLGMVESRDVRIVLWSGPRTAADSVEELVDNAIETAPIGAQMLLFGWQAGIRGGMVTVDPYPILFASDEGALALAPLPEVAEWSDGQALTDLIGRAEQAQ